MAQLGTSRANDVAAFTVPLPPRPASEKSQLREKRDLRKLQTATERTFRKRDFAGTSRNGDTAFLL